MADADLLNEDRIHPPRGTTTAFKRGANEGTSDGQRSWFLIADGRVAEVRR
jgi:hypothetical protein